METVKLVEIRSAEPFANLFPIAPAVLARVQEDMEHHGYDPSQPIVLWAEEGVVIDGHTRLAAARNLGLEEVPVYEKSFADEDAALEYAIHNQAIRRHLTDAEIMRCIEALDRRKQVGRPSYKLAPNGANLDKGKSAQETAKMVGVSTRQVERARAVLAVPQAAAEVKAGKKKISRAYQELRAKGKGQDQPDAAKIQKAGRRAILQTALDEIQPWREKYQDYPELSAVIKAIDDCRRKWMQSEIVPQAEEAAHAPEKPGPCPPVGVEEDCQNPQLIGAVNNESPQCPPDAESTGESVPSTHETGAPESEGQAAEPGASERVTNNQKMCADCRKFTPSLDDPGREGTCPRYPGVSVGNRPVLCPHFESRDHGDADAPPPGIPSEMNKSRVAHAGG